jgi:hypothetical protein
MNSPPTGTKFPTVVVFYDQVPIRESLIIYPFEDAAGGVGSILHATPIMRVEPTFFLEYAALGNQSGSFGRPYNVVSAAYSA